jgi:hypothetical protein
VCHLQLCLLAALSLALAVSCADSQGASTATAAAAAAPLGAYLGCFDLEHVKSLPGVHETGVSVQQVVHQHGLDHHTSLGGKLVGGQQVADYDLQLPEWQLLTAVTDIFDASTVLSGCSTIKTKGCP